MAEPIPSASNAADGETPSNLPQNAEDRKAAAALDALNANDMSQASGETTAKQPSAADQEALGKAMSRLEKASGLHKTTEDVTKKTSVKKELEVRKKVKIASEDVNFLVAELDLSKSKATDLLRNHEGHLETAIRAYIKPSAKA